jgi:glycosyltransferase involved in cell wall biosynthesis
MKVLHVVHAYPPSKGGSQWLTACLAESLATHYGDEATVFTTVARNLDYFWGKDQEVLPAGVSVVNGVLVRRFPVFNRLSRLRWLLSGLAYRLRLPYNDWLRTLEQGPLVPGLRPAIAASQADVVFATAFPLMHMYDALGGAQRGGIPIVMLGALHLDDAWGYQRPMIYRAIRQADAYIAHTPFERDHLVHQQGVCAEKIAVVGAGIDVEPFEQAQGGAVRQSHGWGDAPVLTLVGKHVARKRFDLIIQAMREVWPRYPAARLVLAGGRTKYTPEIEQMVRQLPHAWQTNVHLFTDFDEGQKATLLAASDIFVLPSAHESFGIALLEAWACGKPVIGARRGAIASVIQEGQDGLLFEFPQASSLAQAMLACLDNTPLRRRLGQAGQQKVRRQYTLAAVTAQLRAVYTRVIRPQYQGHPPSASHQ